MEINFIKGIFGQAEFIDIFKKISTMPDNSIDVSWVDPPFGVNYGLGSFSKGGTSYDFSENKVFYEDWTEERFIQMMKALLPELQRIARCVIVHPGYINEKLWWDKVASPDYTLTRLSVASKNGSDNAKIRFRNPLLCYGKPPHSWKTDIFKTLIPWGFIPHYKFVHSCPMNADFMIQLLSECKAQSVFDPMGGSGFIAEAGEFLNISWSLTELDPKYYHDIEMRVWFGQKLRKFFYSQKTLSGKASKPLEYTYQNISETYKQLRDYLVKNKYIVKDHSASALDPRQKQLFPV